MMFEARMADASNGPRPCAVTETHYQVTETLYQDEGKTVYRALRAGADPRPVVLKVLDPRRCRERDLERLRHEYETGAPLDLQTIVRPLSMESYQGMPALVLEDCGGEPLDRLLGALGAPMPLERFLVLASRIAGAVADLHGRGLVHRDLKPANLLVHPTTFEVRIADLGLASRLPREQLPAAPPPLIEGSLPYMSPEQTGRMNRALDSRSDLYSLGVTYYQMLTGRLPFEARDPLEWVHCHVARAPPSPSEIVPDLPEVVSRIVMKLLAKMAEDRYQAAGGLRHDLERCLDQWRRERRIDSFPLGERDAPGRFRVPEKLRGREEQASALLGAFERVVATGRPELVLVSGYSGIGKSSVVQEVRKPLVRERGLFVAGKFEEMARAIPYSAVSRAFADMLLALLSEDEERVQSWRLAAKVALGIHGKLIADVIPPLEILIGEQPPVPELPAAEAEQRLRRTFRDFVGVFAKLEHPLVLFLDDLQWADAESLRLVEDVITSPNTRHVLVIGAYRDNEVGPSHPLARALERIRKATAVSEIVLPSLGVEHVVDIVADATRADKERARPLALLVHEKTGGNPFFIIQFLMTLHREKLLELDETAMTWRWDTAAIRDKGYTDNVVDLMARGLQGLPALARNALEIAASIGNTGELWLLALAHGKSEEGTLADLWEAMREGYVVRAQGSYSFAHDRFQQAAYSLIPEDRRGGVHVAIGRLLLEHTPQERLEERIFDIVTQLDLGAALVTEREERIRVAELNLRAARKARSAAAYRAAVSYLSAGVEMLGAWEPRDLAFALHLELAKCRFLSGAHDQAERGIPELLARARTPLEKATVHLVEIDVQCIKGQGGKAIESALRCLGMLGIDMVAHPSGEEVQRAYEEVWENLGDRRIEDLIDLPPMKDPEMRVAMEILSRLYVPAYYSDNNLFCLHLCHAVNISLRHGNAPSATYAYGWFGVILITTFHRAAEGYRFAKLGYDLVERHRFLAHKAKALSPMKIAAFWTRPIDEELAFARASFEAGVEAGDLVAACFGCQETVVGMLARGDLLSEVELEAERGLDFARKAGFDDIRDLITGNELFVSAMRGRPRHLSAFDDERSGEAELESRLDRERQPSLVFFLLVVKLMARFLSGDLEAAFTVADLCRPLLWAGQFSVQSYWFHLYSALALAAAYHRLDAEGRARARDLLAQHREQLHEWATVNPPTFLGPYALVSAESCRIAGRDVEAERSYEQAIRSSRENGFVQNEALAWELASRFYRTRGVEARADTCLREARACYLRWGADRKVKLIDGILEPRPIALAATFAVRAEQLDLLSVVKASQTISGQVEIEQLAGTLLQVALEQGGARKGYLVLARDSGLFIEAEASLEENGAASRILPSLEVATSALLPVSVLHRACRTREPVILDDASAGASGFDADPYFARSTARSVLCLPILRQDLAGLLYLENDLVAGAFTRDRLAALSLLAAQAAISLENALLLARERAARSAAELLSEAGVLLSQSLEVERTMGGLARLCVSSSLADWCEVHLVDGGQIRLLASACADPSREPLLERLRQRHPASWDSPRPAARCLREGKVIWLPEVSDELLRSLCDDDEHMEAVRGLGSRSALAVPLAARGTTLGALSLASAHSGRHGRADVELAQEIARRAAMAVDNARLYREAQEAIRLREDFLSVASHELRTPAAGLMLSVDSLVALRRAQVADPRTTDKLLDLLVRHGQRLRRLIGDLLDVSQIRTLSLEEIDLVAVVREVLDRLEPQLTLARCSVSFEARAPVTGCWDRSRLDQVVTNFLSNAMKFGRGKPVEIALGAVGDRASLGIRDHGIGISPEFQPRLFGRFERGVSAEHYGGLGLGLYICRRIVEAHGGSIRVESQLGAGATFTVELPRAGPGAGPQASS
jgi:predicted ATPase/signal transduction histidine kinase